ncbi:MAG: ATP F0F1 synthase subunit B [Beijerinckiaceae bacterium]|nr:ATP F0F1 synthase subunit B [Beijerinckiaceae bacterium]MCZ8298884.1 ATP F0F1 synthase subunit B [Beijerinckiaceae bacterium]
MTAEFWVAASFFIFLGILGYFGVHTKILGALDARGARIKAQLDEAERLRNEAAALLKSYEAKRVAAEQEAAGIVSAAQDEAKRLEAEAKAKLEDFVKRRTEQAEMKIQQAESQAMAEVRSAAVDLATKAAAQILSAAKGDDAFAAGLEDVKKRLN